MTVRIPMPEVDRGREDARSILAIVMEEISQGFHRLGTRIGASNSYIAGNTVKLLPDRGTYLMCTTKMYEYDIKLLYFLTIIVTAVARNVNYHLEDLLNPNLFEGDIIGIKNNDVRNAITNRNLKWPNGIVPYIIDPSLANVTNRIKEAMDEITGTTCIKFVPRTTEENYVRFFRGEGCYSKVGRNGGSQPISLGRGCHVKNIIVHEIGHALGFYHEHSRSDRDSYLIIHWDNIRTNMASQFRKLQPNQNILFNNFDINSIMLYGETAFSKDGVSKTISSKSGVRLKKTNEKPGLSTSDISRIKALYEC
ncbi:astacin-like metalloprotease toxin 5 [Centruroides sculpturatus]|uniref:astacin-like metalloprotease toxin 5 n=1 Tax=Centruroides sculpturatus TaxID=218467 RepID=UPI000C6DA987|nr:astacin-like metalloprotease toxin 5 [Centruroides sculpturatus]